MESYEINEILNSRKILHQSNNDLVRLNEVEEIIKQISQPIYPFNIKEGYINIIRCDTVKNIAPIINIIKKYTTLTVIEDCNYMITLKDKIKLLTEIGDGFVFITYINKKIFSINNRFQHLLNIDIGFFSRKLIRSEYMYYIGGVKYSENEIERMFDMYLRELKLKKINKIHH